MDSEEGRSWLQVNAGKGVVPHHHHPRTGFHRGTERHQLDLLEPLAVVVEHGKLIVRIDHRVPLAGEVLGRRCHPFRLEPTHHRRRQLAHPSRVVAEGADAERWVVGMRGQIANRGVVDRDPECSQLTTHRLSHRLGEFDVIDSTQSHVPRKGGGGRPGAEQLAPLVVGGDQQWEVGAGRLLQCGGEERRLRHRAHVAVAEEGDTRPVREHVRQPSWNLDTFEGGHERPLGAHFSP